MLYESANGLGVLLGMGLDRSADRVGGHRSMRLLGEEVMPRVADLTGE